MNESDWRELLPRIEQLAVKAGLSFNPVDFEEVPDTFMMEISVYGLPVRMPHWSFGVRYIYQLVQHRMGHSRLFEVVFPGNPGHAYLANSNSVAENVLVAAHVLGHADFSRNNLLFRRSQQQVGENIVEHAANHARQIGRAIDEHGLQRVEATLDAALALEQHIDMNQSLQRERYPEYLPPKAEASDDTFRKRFVSLEPRCDRRCSAWSATRASPAASRARPAVVHSAIRTRARRLGARHLPRRARGVLLLLSGVRDPDHERGLGLVLARTPVARGRLSVAASLRRCHQVSFRCRASARQRRAGRAHDQSLPPGLQPVGSNRGEGRARGGARHPATGR